MALFDLGPSWGRVLSEELHKPYIGQLAEFVAKERREGPVYPPEELVFQAFWQTPYDRVKVVIVGQDPYHGLGQANGLAFSVSEGVLPPPSLRNIFKELQADIGCSIPATGNLLPWSRQGVLLLNTTLTVQQERPLSHHKQGWERLTDAAIYALSMRQKPTVFLLWGRSAQQKGRHIVQNSDHLVLKTSHPSPLSAHQGFFGSRPFSQTNQFLEEKGLMPIHWVL